MKWDQVKLGQLTCRRWDSECWDGTSPGCPSLSVPVSGSHKGHTGVQSQGGKGDDRKWRVSPGWLGRVGVGWK